MATPEDLTGKRFGRLIVIQNFGKRSDHGRVLRECECDCGSIVFCDITLLKNGSTQSCGCLHKEQLVNRSTTHGLTGTPEHNTWRTMKGRCFNPRNPKYKDYGERGITVYQPWADDFMSFYNYLLESIGLKPEGKSIDRIDNDGNYEPGNIRWARDDEQARNRRSTVKWTYNGETLSVIEWSERTGVKFSTLYSRVYKLGWTIERALTTK